MKFTEAKKKTHGRLYELAGHIGPWKVVTDNNLTTQNGWEYIRVPKFKCAIFFWIKETVKIANMEPSTAIYVVKETNTIYMHSDMLEDFKLQCEKDNIKEKIEKAELGQEEFVKPTNKKEL